MNKERFKKIISRLGLGLLAVLLLSILRFPATAEVPKHYTELELPPPPEIELPEYEQYELDNGMVVYLLEDHDLPLVNGTALIRTGSRWEPEEQVGLAELTGTVMRSGGTQSHPADQLNLMLEQRAASIESSIETTSGSVNFDTLTEDLDTVFNLFAEVIRKPAFAADQLELAKNQQRGAIARRNDNPSDIASREFDKLIYGEDSPYARTVEYVTLDNISREDVINFYQNYVRPESIILGIVGDFEPAKMKAAIAEAFENWQVTSTPPQLEVPPATQKHDKGVFLVDRPELTQSTVSIGHLDGTLNDPDYPTLSVLNGTMNSFGGRLFNEVRSRQGLAYSVYSVWNPNYDYPGTFTAGGQTQSETTVPFVQSILTEIERLRTTPISQEELTRAKESILNSFVFNFETPSQTLARLMRYKYFGYPEDFIFQYQEGVKTTTVEDIQRVAQQHLHPDKMVTLVVGSNRAIEPPLSSLGTEVKTVDISIPQSPTS
ncbi:insulinase family protein [Pleurocapsales cyanobacterium LEGE 06147]|nr:insulinase family protein [Pleurocapsales cyanobacterium LEGE 06147]